MRTLLLILMASFMAARAEAQLGGLLDGKSVKGAFYVSVDDAATIFVNGTKVFHADIGEHRSPETELKAGDRLLVRMTNNGGPRHLVLVFASTDGQSVVSFKAHDFKILPDIDVSDFAVDQYQKLTKSPKEQKHKSVLPVRNNSDAMWGDLDHCIIVCVMTPQMFAHVTR